MADQESPLTDRRHRALGAKVTMLNLRDLIFSQSQTQTQSQSHSQSQSQSQSQSLSQSLSQIDVHLQDSLSENLESIVDHEVSLEPVYNDEEYMVDYRVDTDPPKRVSRKVRRGARYSEEAPLEKTNPAIMSYIYAASPELVYLKRAKCFAENVASQEVRSTCNYTAAHCSIEFFACHYDILLLIVTSPTQHTVHSSDCSILLHSMTFFSDSPRLLYSLHNTMFYSKQLCTNIQSTSQNILIIS